MNGNIDEEDTLDYIKIVVENIKPYESKELKGRDRIVHHRRRLRHAFEPVDIRTNPELFKYNKYQIYSINGYYGGDKKNFGEYIFITLKNKVVAVFNYDDNENRFAEIPEEEYIDAVLNGFNPVSSVNIPGINQKVKQARNKQKEENTNPQEGEEPEV